jgi:uracil phosphoribosyltransferase
LVFRDSWAEGLLADIAGDPDVGTVTSAIDRLAASLFGALGPRFATSPPVPIVILRGGLLMLDAAREATGASPWGFLLPATRGRGEPVTIERADLPGTGPGASYLLVDPIVNSGETVLAALEALEKLGVASTSLEPVRIACVFLTASGEERIRSRYPDLEIYTVWDRMTLEPDGWVSGVGFDAGDYAVGGGKRLRWAAASADGRMSSIAATDRAREATAGNPRFGERSWA